MRNSNLSLKLGCHVKISREIAKIWWITRENSGKSRKNACHYSPTPNTFLESFPFKSTCNFLPSLCKVWGNLKILLLRYEFFKNREVFPILRLFSLLRPTLQAEFDRVWNFTRKIYFWIFFLELLGLVAPKINKRVENEVEKQWKLKIFTEGTTMTLWGWRFVKLYIY